MPTYLLSWSCVATCVSKGTCAYVLDILGNCGATRGPNVCVRVFVYNWCPRLIVRVCVCVRRLYTLYAYVLHWCCLGLTVRNIVVLEVIGVPRLRCLYRSRL